VRRNRNDERAMPTRHDTTWLSCSDRGDAVISSVFRNESRARRLLRWASVARALSLMTIVVAASEACVVSPSASTFSSQDSCPPYFVTDQASPVTNKISEIIDTKITSFTAKVPIRSCYTKDFVVRTFLDGTLLHDQTLSFQGGDTRDADILIPIASTNLSKDGCHLVELLASKSFAVGGDLRAPASPGDLALISWLVYVHTSSIPVAPITDCPTIIPSGP
jgi:hypothetical protein